MTDIPDDIMNAARKLAVKLGHFSDSEAPKIIALAILAERKRCAITGYRICAETRHVTLGVEVRDAIMKGPMT